MERKLASIQVITDLSPIENADKLELATVLGWKVVVPKGIHKVGENVVFFEIDSLLPNKECYSFLKSCWNERLQGFRIKTIKLRGQISQGLVLPIKELFSDAESDIYIEGYDITNILEVTKYEPKQDNKGNLNSFGRIKKASNFPYFVPKTDAIRIQSAPFLLKSKNDNPFVIITEKVDGSSATYFINNGEFGICSRNYHLELEPETETVEITNIWHKVAIEYDIEAKLRSLDGNYAIQGEIYGSKINGNHYKLQDVRFAMYGVYDIDNKCYIDFMTSRYSNTLLPSIPTVPLRGIIEMPKTIDECLHLSTFTSSIADVPAEGIVVTFWLDGNRHIFKVINNEFLLAKNE